MPISHEIREKLEAKPHGRAVVAALERLFAGDAHFLIVDADERSISFRFGMYLHAEPT